MARVSEKRARARVLARLRVVRSARLATCAMARQARLLVFSRRRSLCLVTLLPMMIFFEGGLVMSARGRSASGSGATPDESWLVSYTRAARRSTYAGLNRRARRVRTLQRAETCSARCAAARQAPTACLCCTVMACTSGRSSTITRTRRRCRPRSQTHNMPLRRPPCSTINSCTHFAMCSALGCAPQEARRDARARPAAARAARVRAHAEDRTPARAVVRVGGGL